MAATSGAAFQPPVWRDDEEVKSCAGCGAKFSVILRKHHCRGCGDVFCAKCVPYRRPAPHLGFEASVKLCKACASPQVLNTSTIPCRGGELVVRGHNFFFFGLEKKLNDFLCSDIEVTVDGQPCSEVRVSQQGMQHTLRCRAPPGAGRDHELCIRFLELRGAALVHYAAPQVDSVDRVPTKGGKLTVFGRNLEADPKDIQVLTNSSEATGVRVKNAGQILTCQVPSGAGSRLPLHLSIAGYAVDTVFSYAPPTVRSPVRVPYRGGWVRVRGSNLGHSADQVVVVVEEEALPADCVRMQTPHRALSVQFPLGTLARAGRKLPLVVQVAGQRAHAEFLYEVPDLPTPPPLPGRVWALQAAPDGLALARRRRQYRLRREAEEERAKAEKLQRKAQDEAAREQRRSRQRRSSHAQRRMEAARHAMVPATQGAYAGHQRSTSASSASAAAAAATAAVSGGKPGAGPIPFAPVDGTRGGAPRHNRSRSLMVGARARSTAALMAPASMGRDSGGDGGSGGGGGGGGYMARLHRVGSALPRPRFGDKGGRGGDKEDAVVSRRAVRRRLLRATSVSEHSAPSLAEGAPRLSAQAPPGAPPPPLDSRAIDGGGGRAGSVRAEAGDAMDAAEEAAVAPALRATLQQFMRLMRIARKQRLLVPEETDAFVGAMRGALRPDGAQMPL